MSEHADFHWDESRVSERSFIIDKLELSEEEDRSSDTEDDSRGTEAARAGLGGGGH